VTLDAPVAPTFPTTTGLPAGLLATIAAEVRVVEGGFRLGGLTVPAPGRCPIEPLTRALFRRYHLGIGLGGAVDDPVAEDPRFVRRVRNLLGSRAYWEGGWEIVGRTDSGQWLVERDDLVLTVGHEELSGTRGRVRVRFPAERPRAVSGWFSVTGVRGPAVRAVPLAAVHLNLRPDSAAAVFTDLVSGLDALHVRFTARVLNHPAAYGRPDSAVVVAPREQLPLVARSVLGLHPRARDGFGDAVPGFTRALAPGVAIADEPPVPGGIGRHRCRVIAAGLLAAGDVPPAARLAAVLRSLAAERLDPSALHLEPGNADFDLPQW
jgi:hypothetical protein